MAHAEARRQPGTVDRRAHQELAQRAAGAVVVLDLAVLDLEAVGVDDLARQREPGVEHVAAAHAARAVLETDLLEHRLEAVARAQVALEVDVPAEHLDQVVGHVLRQLDARRREVEAVVDHRVAAHDLAMLRAVELGRAIATLGVAGDADLMVEAEVEGKAQQIALAVVAGALRRGQRELLAGAQLARIVDAAQRLQRGVGLAVLDAGAQQDVHQRVAAAHHDLLDRAVRHRAAVEACLLEDLGLAREIAAARAGRRQQRDLRRPRERRERAGGRALRCDRAQQRRRRRLRRQGFGWRRVGRRGSRSGGAAGGAAAGSAASARPSPSQLPGVSASGTAGPSSGPSAGSTSAASGGSPPATRIAPSLSCVVITPAAKPTPKVATIIASKTRSRVPFSQLRCTRFTRLDVSVRGVFCVADPAFARQQCLVILKVSRKT